MSLLSPQLVAFIAVSQLKTVHAAAEQLHLTQTAITQRIRVLEGSLKATLFIRTRRGMQLTTEGEALLRYCYAAQALEGEALASIQGSGTEADVALTISAPTSLMRSRIIPRCLPIMQRFPRLLLHFDVDDYENRHQKLRSGQCDFAIVLSSDVSQELCSKPLAPEQYILVGSAAWKGRKLKDIVEKERIIDFNTTDDFTSDYLREYQLLEYAKPGRYYVNRTDNIAYLVTQGLGYTTLSKEFALPYLEDESLIVLNKGQAYNFTPVLTWYNRPEPSDYFTAILDAIS